MAEVETSNKPTILDYLNKDCWRAVLDYVPVKHIILSERVSRQWQAVTLAYLQRIRFGIERPYVRVSEAVANVHRVTLAEEKFPLFWRWTCKLGASVVATYCKTEECLETITENCPNLEAITFLTLTEQQLQMIQIEHFKFLQSIRFINCDLSDHFISQFIADKALEELQIWLNNEEMTGRFLLDIELTSLKSLHLYGCYALECRYLLLAAVRLTELRRLVLRAVSQDIYKQLHLVFRRTVKLEYLHLFSIDEKGRLFEGICRLGRLRHLSVSCVATDADVKAVARCCKELRTLELVNCDKISKLGLEVVVACTAAARLTSLSIHNNQRLYDDNVVAIVQQCPSLTISELKGINHIHKDNEIFARRTIKVPITPHSVLTELMPPPLDPIPSTSKNTPGTHSVINNHNGLPQSNSRIENREINGNNDFAINCNALYCKVYSTIAPAVVPYTQLLPNKPRESVETVVVKELTSHGADFGLKWYLLLCVVLVLGVVIPIVHIFVNYVDKHEIVESKIIDDLPPVHSP